MAQSLHKTKRRIASVNSTKKITKAMELVATVKLKRFKNVMLENEAYAKELVDIIHHLFAHIDVEDNPYLVETKSETDLYIVVSSNLGLCASYNNNIFNFVNGNVKKDKTEIIKEMLELLVAQSKIKASDKDGVLEAVMRRESQMSTGIQCGVASPHGKTD